MESFKNILGKLFKGYLVYVVVITIGVAFGSKVYFYEPMTKLANDNPDYNDRVLLAHKSGFKSTDPEVQNYINFKIKNVEEYIKRIKNERDVNLKKHKDIIALGESSNIFSMVPCEDISGLINNMYLIGQDYIPEFKMLKKEYPNCIDYIGLNASEEILKVIKEYR